MTTATRPCAGCGHGNGADAKFCAECGAALAFACPTCTAPIPGGARFCTQCGTPSAPAAIAPLAPPDAPVPSGERKHVTVLFADVARSMELAERLDADEWTVIMRGLFSVCREAVEAFGGTVDKFTGDGIMALFGAPVALEDHARRSCHAALRLVEGAAEYAATVKARGVDLAVRVGLNSGEVVAGSVGGDAVGGAYTAVGHTVGLAQRMETLAQPGTVYLSEHTAALIGGGFRLLDLGRAEVKGVAAAVGVFALEGVAGASSDAGRRRSGSARMVGRGLEVATLEAALAGAHEGRAQVVGIVGDAGSGKSRLCEEIAARAEELGITVHRTAGVSHAQSVPLLPIIGYVRDYFGIAAADTPAQVRANVGARLLAMDPAFESDLGLLFDFLEVPDPDRPAPSLGPDARRRRILEAFRRTTMRRTEHQTVLMVLDDLHWFDPQSVAFLDAWLPSFPGTRTLVVTNFRPEFHPPWARHSYYRQLPLAPLDNSAVDELLGELIGADPELAALSEQLRSRAGGNPFFVEEIVRSLAGDGTLEGTPGDYRLTGSAAEVRVPPTVQAVLADRIDRLDPQEKAVLQAAAVIGRTFTDAILRSVAGIDPDELFDALRVLCAEEMLQEIDDEYRFWHPLTQEVAYGTLLGARRRRLHQKVAAALVGLGPDRHDELAALIATHAEAAGDDLEAARWQLHAGHRAVRGDWAEAQRRLRAALDHLAEVPESQDALTLGVRARTVLLRVGARVGMDTEEAGRLFAEARPAAERLDDPALLAAISLADGTVRVFAGDVVGCAASYREVCRLAVQSGDRGMLAFGESALSILTTFTGPLPEGLRVAEAAVARCGDDPLTGVAQAGYSAHDFAHFARFCNLVPAGELSEARAAAAAVRANYAQRPMAEWHTWTMALIAHLTDWTGEPDELTEARAAMDEALRLAGECGNVWAGAKASQASGLVALLAGRPAEAADTFAEALAEIRRHRPGLLEESSLLSHLARAQLATGDGDGARVSVDEAVAIARGQRTKVTECLAHLVRARVFRETAIDDMDLAEARVAVAVGEALASETGAVTHAAFLAEERARLECDPDALRAAADGFDAIGATGHARRLRAELHADATFPAGSEPAE